MKSTRVLGTILIALIVLLAGALFVGGLYLNKEASITTYFAGTVINGRPADEKTPQQMLQELVKEHTSVNIVIRENEKDAISGTLADFGYEIDERQLLGSLESCLEKQKENMLALVTSLMHGNSFAVTIPFKYTKDVFRKKVCAAGLPEERYSSVDAEIRFDEKTKEYSIVPEKYGNEFSDQEFQNVVKAQIDSFMTGNHPGETLTIDFPKQIYILPEVTAEDVELNSTINIYNSYVKSEITYEFGSYTEKVDWDTIRTWLSIEDGEARWDEEAMYLYVMDLASRYNTRHYDRHFHTSIGTDIVIPSYENDYGYTINEDAEFSQLLSDVKGNAPVKREPVYYDESSAYGNPLYYRRDGRDDLAGNYVEVNLSMQHLWFYKDGGLVVESDIVSGCVARNSETKTGTFPLAYKESPSVLVGADAANGYRTEVQYWMPFYDGQGLHDAKWRGSFGGGIYKTNGSHGCINLPPYVAEQIYYYIDAGMAIIIYK